MGLFIRFYREMILILLFGLIMNQYNGILKLSLFFIVLIWIIFHFFTIKNLYSDSKLLENLIIESKEDIVEDENVKKRFKISEKNSKIIKKYYSYLILAPIFTLSLYMGGSLVIFGVLFVIVELIKLIKINSIVKKAESITNH